MRGTIREHAIVGKGDGNLVFPTCCLRTVSVKSLCLCYPRMRLTGNGGSSESCNGPESKTQCIDQQDTMRRRKMRINLVG